MPQFRELLYNSFIMHKRKKVSIIGSGFVGSTCAHWLASEKIADIALIDTNEGLAKGRALDLLQAMALSGGDLAIKGGSQYELVEGSDIVVITAGLSRKPGMNRQDLLSKNAQIMKAICSQLKERHLDNTIFIVVSNPLDAMVYLVGKELQLPRERIIGMAGVLDTARFKTFIAAALNVSVEDISAMVLGGHGDSMVPLIRLCTVGGVPLEQLMDKKTLVQIVERTKKGGGEIVGLLKTGSAFYAPSLSVVQMVEAILLDKKRVLPCAALLQGEYGAEDIFAGVPCRLGGQGMEKILEISLSPEEREQFKNSLAAVKQTLSELEQTEF